MKNELFYPGSSIREQIKAGGADDWQLRLGHYVVSLRYVTPERRGALSRLAGIFCRSERLAAVVYRRQQDGRLEAGGYAANNCTRTACEYVDRRPNGDEGLGTARADVRFCGFGLARSGIYRRPVGACCIRRPSVRR